MTFFTALLDNRIWWAGISGWIAAQVLKTLLHFFFTKDFSPERLVGSGGMPSSHSATVCALLTAVCFEHGPGGFEFAVTFLFAMIVMHDAMGVRRETGKQAQVINDMTEVFKKMGHSDITPEQALKEFVGHSPLQVLAGAVLGILISILLYTH